MLKLFQEVVIASQPRSLGSSLSVAFTHFSDRVQWPRKDGCGPGGQLSRVFTPHRPAATENKGGSKCEHVHQWKCTGGTKLGGWLTPTKAKVMGEALPHNSRSEWNQ